MTEGSLSLSELLGQVKDALGKALPDSYWVVAEILELHENRSGHCYLELVEKSASDDKLTARARGTIWATRYRMLRPFFETTTNTRLKSGIKLLFKASVEFHPLFGFSLNITDIDPAYTLGDLARKKQEVIRRLKEEGVMDMNRDIPFPTVPQRIAVISSESAAGYGDFMESIRNNTHGFRFMVRLFPAVMQGDEMPVSVMAAFDRIFSSEDDFDCVAMIRGGGSKGDLESFNSYDLAYYITQFPLPVITGIGHERDESVADMVAAFGLKTPTAVAEFLVDRLLSFEFHLSGLQERLAMSVKRSVLHHTQGLERLTGSLQHLSKRYLEGKHELLSRSTLLLERGTAALLGRKRDQLVLLETRTGLVDPVNVLKRGYSITIKEGVAVTSIHQVSPGELLETRLADGVFRSSVTDIHDTTTTSEKKKINPEKDGKGKDQL